MRAALAAVPQGRSALIAAVLVALLVVTVIGGAVLVLPQAGKATASRSGSSEGSSVLPTPLGGVTAEGIARRLTVAYRDTQAVWHEYFAARLGRLYHRPELVFFSRTMPSPCAGARVVSGPFYCRHNHYAAFDLVFFDALLLRLGPGGGKGLALIVARITASHVQSELLILRDAERRRATMGPGDRARLDLAVTLQADCLAGVWARRAESRIGQLPEGAFGRALEAARSTAAELEAHGQGPPASQNPFQIGSLVERDAAFERGYTAGDLADCLAPGLQGSLI